VFSQDTRLERDANLSRFAGSNSISSAEYFGERTRTNQQPSFSVSAPDLDEVRFHVFIFSIVSASIEVRKRYSSTGRM
jgi:hypothetical protein